MEHERNCRPGDGGVRRHRSPAARGDERPVAAHQSPMIADGDSSPRRGLQALEVLANTDADDAALGVVDAAVAVRRER